MFKKPIHRASVLALSLFGLLLYLTWMPETKVSDDAAQLKWPIELELQADLGGLALSQEIVQDTLSWHAGHLATALTDLKSSWRYQFCCDDAMSMSRDEQVFRGKLSLEVPNEGLRSALLGELLRRGYVDLKAVERRGAWTCGRVDLALPIPGSGETLVLTEVGFGLQIPAGQAHRYHS